VVTCEIKHYFNIISVFVDVRLKQFYFSASKSASNYFEIIPEAYCRLLNIFQHVQCR